MRIAKLLPSWLPLLMLTLAAGLAAGESRSGVADTQTTAALYVADFVATAATGTAMNDAGDVVGTSYTDPGCGPFCLPPNDTVVWRRGRRIVLPPLPGLSGIYPSSINSQGWVSGFAGFPGTTTHAVVWKPSGNTYVAIDLGTLPGTTISYAAGIDNLGRVVGWSTTSNFPPSGSPFVWTESTGMLDLSAHGFPDEQPLAVSPAGTVATPSTWYQLDDPASVVPVPPPPQGFYPPGTYPTVINDAGDQARFLVSTGPQNLVYLFRLHHEGTWQQLSPSGTGHLTTYGVGSINAGRDVTATIQGTAVIASGPNGLAQPLAPFLSPAYPGATIGRGGPMNSSGQILAQVMIGRSQRLMKLTPANACGSGCIQVGKLPMRGKFVQDPNDPGHCTPGGNMYNLSQAKLTVTDENGVPLAGVLLGGRFLDDYWTNKPVSGTTNSQGIVSFVNKGPCGVGAVAFLVDRAIKGTRTFDRTTGTLTNWVIPQ
jgi:probable HAF family extracellular repeat protein